MRRDPDPLIKENEQRTTVNDFANFRLNAGGIRFVGRDLSRPECVVAEADGTLWVSDDRAAVTRIDPDGRQTLIGSMRAAPNGLAMDRAGTLYVANIDDGKVYRLHRDGREEVILDRFEGRPLGSVNFPYIDANDRLWITVSTVTTPRIQAVQSPIPDGYILRMDPGGPVKVVDGLCFTNEMRIRADGRMLYVVESMLGCVSCRPILAGGALGPRGVHGPAPVFEGAVLDGIALDEQGNVWATEVRRNAIVVITPEGRAHTVFEDPKGETLVFPTSIAFGGADRRTAYVGSLKLNRLASFRSPVAGAPMAHWKG